MRDFLSVVLEAGLNLFQFRLEGGHGSGRFDLLQREPHSKKADQRGQADDAKAKVVEQKQIEKHQAVGQWPHNRFSKQVSYDHERNDVQIASLPLL